MIPAAPRQTPTEPPAAASRPETLPKAPDPAWGQQAGMPGRADGQRLAASIGALVTVDDLAHLLDVTTRAVWGMVQRGDLPAPDFRIGKRICRWKVATIRRFVEQGGKR